MATKRKTTFYSFPSSYFCCYWIRDGKNQNPEFRINIMNLQHWKNLETHYDVARFTRTENPAGDKLRILTSDADPVGTFH
jgi:hypothetical protein